MILYTMYQQGGWDQIVWVDLCPCFALTSLPYVCAQILSKTFCVLPTSPRDVVRQTTVSACRNDSY